GAEDEVDRVLQRQVDLVHGALHHGEHQRAGEVLRQVALELPAERRRVPRRLLSLASWPHRSVEFSVWVGCSSPGRGCHDRTGIGRRCDDERRGRACPSVAPARSFTSMRTASRPSMTRAPPLPSSSWTTPTLPAKGPSSTRTRAPFSTGPGAG